MQLRQISQNALQQFEKDLELQYQAIGAQKLSLDLTRGKPSAEQLSLSDALDGLLNGDYKSLDGTDTRNYGGLDGLDEVKQLGAEILELSNTEVLVGGNSSLTLMFQAALTAYHFGLRGPDSAWKHEGGAKFLCPVPGYDRHFTVCEQLGIEMLTIPMTATGPDMDAVEAAVKADANIKGMWCVPKYSNPTGIIYSDETVERVAALGKIAGPNFRVFWDNAYVVHGHSNIRAPLANVMEACKRAGTEDSVLQFASTSKITHAGSGIAFMGASAANLKGFKQFLGSCTIGPDKVNQLRHIRLLPNIDALLSHMKQHAAIVKPRFDAVLSALDSTFNGENDFAGIGSWEKPDGGYFVSFDTQPGLAREVVRLAADAGVKLTPAGATFPYGKDPEDSNIRIAPTVPSVEEVRSAMDVFVVCTKLATVRQALANN